MKTFQIVIGIFYTIVLFAAFSQTTGLVAAACLVMGILSIVSNILTILAFSINHFVENKRGK